MIRYDILHQYGHEMIWYSAKIHCNKWIKPIFQENMDIKQPGWNPIPRGFRNLTQLNVPQCTSPIKLAMNAHIYTPVFNREAMYTQLWCEPYQIRYILFKYSKVLPQNIIYSCKNVVRNCTITQSIWDSKATLRSVSNTINSEHIHLV